MWKSVFAISSRAALGAPWRWQLGARLNSLLPSLPPDTLTANLIGGYVIGLVVAFFAQTSNIAPVIKGYQITFFTQQDRMSPHGT